jgi:hypothetical protein
MNSYGLISMPAAQAGSGGTQVNTFSIGSSSSHDPEPLEGGKRAPTAPRPGFRKRRVKKHRKSAQPIQQVIQEQIKQKPRSSIKNIKGKGKEVSSFEKGWKAPYPDAILEQWTQGVLKIPQIKEDMVDQKDQSSAMNSKVNENLWKQEANEHSLLVAEANELELLLKFPVLHPHNM